MQDIIEQLRAELPAVFAGTSIGELTGNAVNWGTIQNLRSQQKIPDECFVRSGRRVLVIRDRFLDWWATTLSEARQPAVSKSNSRTGAADTGAGTQ
jgi:hypothetical protein